MILAHFVYICDYCKKIEASIEETGTYEEFDIVLPEGWTNIYSSDGRTSKECCPECLQKEKENVEVGEYGFLYEKKLS